MQSPHFLSTAPDLNIFPQTRHIGLSGDLRPSEHLSHKTFSMPEFEIMPASRKKNPHAWHFNGKKASVKELAMRINILFTKDEGMEIMPYA